MQISINFKNFESSDPLKSHIDKKLSRLDKMLDGPAEAYLVLSIKKFRNIAEITLKSDKLTINAKEESENMYATIDVLADKLKAQIIKNKEKLRRHQAGDKETIKNSDFTLDQPEEIAV